MKKLFFHYLSDKKFILLSFMFHFILEKNETAVRTSLMLKRIIYDCHLYMTMTSDVLFLVNSSASMLQR